jgi:hypothetical protein
MYIKIENHQKNNVRIIEYPGDMSLFIAAHCFGVFNVAKIKPGVYCFYDRFTGEIIDTISKPGKREITKYLNGGI